ncbi:hypothetical protein ONZ45_g12244 [Pleurotus djamor]|nr:hypothetical protein ONZ45_g12244 [Pleurotus djamor]
MNAVANERSKSSSALVSVTTAGRRRRKEKAQGASPPGWNTPVLDETGGVEDADGGGAVVDAHVAVDDGQVVEKLLSHEIEYTKEAPYGRVFKLLRDHLPATLPLFDISTLSKLPRNLAVNPARWALRPSDARVFNRRPVWR